MCFQCLTKLIHGNFSMMCCPYDVQLATSKLFRTPLHRQMQNINSTLDSQQTLHISPSRVSYGVSIVRNLEKIHRVITAPRCIITFYPYRRILCAEIWQSTACGDFLLVCCDSHHMFLQRQTDLISNTSGEQITFLYPSRRFTESVGGVLRGPG